MNTRYPLIAVLGMIAIVLVLVFPVAALPGATSTATWNPQSSGTTNWLNSVHFINASEGWITGAGGTLLKTTNGGSTWSAVTNTGVDPSKGFNSVRFLDQNVGWVGGLYSVIRTLDGGANWEGIQYSSYDYRNALFPVSSTVAWAVGGSGIGPGRIHWRYTFFDGAIQDERWATTSPSGLMSVHFVDPDNGWSVGWPGMIIRISSASGSSPVFSVQTSGTTQQLNEVQMLDTNNGWVVGNLGTILRTTDGGNTWIPKTSGTSVDLKGVYFIDPHLGWVVGEGGLILATSDGGNTWTPESSGVTSELSGVFFVDAVNGYAVGANGVILARETNRLYLPLILNGYGGG
jgi:photosystem II stability/assembly factor-like uncharacterized protein